MPLYAAEFESSFSLISLTVGALPLGTMLADVPAGMILDRIGRRRMMLLGCGLLAMSYLALWLAHVYPELVLDRLIGGVGTAFWSISRIAFIAESVPSGKRGRALSTFGGLQRAGTFIGPAVGGLVATMFGLGSTFLLAAIVGGIALGMSFLFVPETGGDRKIQGQRAKWAMMFRLLRPKVGDVFGASAVQVFANMIRSGRQIIVPLFGSVILGLDAGAIGTIVSLSAGVEVLLFVPAGMLMDRLGRRYAMVPSFIVMGAGMALLPFSTGYLGLLLASSVMGIGNGLSSGTMMTLGADLAPPGVTGEFLGLWRLVGDGGQMGGPLVVGTIADLIGLGPAAFVLAAVGLLSSLTAVKFVSETLEQPPAMPAAD